LILGFGREKEEVELEGRKSFRLSVSKGLPACFVAVTGDSKQASHHKTKRKCVRSGMVLGERLQVLQQNAFAAERRVTDRHD
jgi:hypothetical protein